MVDALARAEALPWDEIAAAVRMPFDSGTVAVWAIAVGSPLAFVEWGDPYPGPDPGVAAAFDAGGHPYEIDLSPGPGYRLYAACGCQDSGTDPGISPTGSPGSP